MCVYGNSIEKGKRVNEELTRESRWSSISWKACDDHEKLVMIIKASSACKLPSKISKHSPLYPLYGSLDSHEKQQHDCQSWHVSSTPWGCCLSQLLHLGQRWQLNIPLPLLATLKDPALALSCTSSALVNLHHKGTDHKANRYLFSHSRCFICLHSIKIWKPSDE